jgi:hypothetical protein
MKSSASRGGVRITSNNKQMGTATRESRTLLRWAAWLLAGIVLPGAASFAAGEPAALPESIKPLGDERYRIGGILVDRKARRFTLPARMHVLEKPLEYLLTTTGGMKEYEALLETDVSGTEFNLACILLGLEPPADLSSLYQFSKTPLDGSPVQISLAWEQGGKRQQVTAEQALIEPEDLGKEVVEWIYVGSNMGGGRFAADMTGTLVGFVHDNNSVIDTRYGLGIGSYGSINGNSKLLPPVGSAVEVVVEVPLPARASEDRAGP